MRRTGWAQVQESEREAGGSEVYVPLSLERNEHSRAGITPMGARKGTSKVY